MTAMESWYTVISTDLECPDLPFSKKAGGSSRLSVGFMPMKTSTLLPSDTMTQCVKDLRGSLLSA